MAAVSSSSASSRLQLALCIIGLLAVAPVLQASQSTSSRGYAADSKTHLQQTCPEAVQDGRETCPLWGCRGESWTQGGLLDDWSFAGYGAGLEAIPNSPVSVDVKRDFHATGNGVTDDTVAIRAAIEATKDTGGVIYFPPGKYILSDQLFLNSYQVLRGAGRDQTNLRFTRSLADLRGWGQNYTAGKGRSKFTWAGAMITNQQQKGVFPQSTNLHLGHVVKPAKRGDTRLYLGNLVRNSSSAELIIKPGQWVTIGMAENAEGDLARMLYNNKTAGGYSLRTFARQFMLSHMTRVNAVGKDWIDIERPMHVDISLKHPVILAKTANYKVTGMGVEDLEVSFPWTAYMGHHEEAGYNAIEYIGAVNCWVRRIRVVNSDSGVRLYGSLFNTISDVEITNAPWTRKGGRWVGRESVWQLTEADGHMGIALHWASHDNLVEKFNITGIYYHDLLVAAYSSHNVFSQGRGIDVCMDHHGAAPNNNLWTDIDLGLGQGAMRWSGDAGSNPFAGKLNTFWGIWASSLPVKPDYVSQLAAAKASMRQMQQAARLYMLSRAADTQGYQQVVVDMPLDSSMPTIREAGDWLIHYNPDQRIYPGNLYKAMVATTGYRLKLGRNGTFLSDTYPRPPTAGAWKPIPVKHPAVARPVEVKPDPDCLNLGCQGIFKNASWVHAALDPAERANRQSESNRIPVAESVVNLSNSVLASSSNWLFAAGKATASLGGISGVWPNNSSSMYMGATLSLGPVSAIATDLVNTLKQVVTVANSLLVTLAGGLPAQAVTLVAPGAAPAPLVQQTQPAAKAGTGKVAPAPPTKAATAPGTPAKAGPAPAQPAKVPAAPAPGKSGVPTAPAAPAGKSVTAAAAPAHHAQPVKSGAPTPAAPVKGAPAAPVKGAPAAAVRGAPAAPAPAGSSPKAPPGQQAPHRGQGKVGLQPPQPSAPKPPPAGPAQGVNRVANSRSMLFV